MHVSFSRGAAALLLAVVLAATTFSADLVRVAPITNKILMLEFDEGHIDYFGYGQDRYNGNKVYYSALNVNAAKQTTNYSLVSADDDFYKTARQPLTIGRKAKGVDFHNLYDNSNPKDIKTHWIYIELPQALKQGKSYTLTLKEIAGNTNQHSFVFDVNKLMSETVHVNQIGFVPTSTKYAYLSHFIGDFDSEKHAKGGLSLDDLAGSSFHVIRRADNQTVYSGEIKLRTRKTNQEFKHDSFNNPNPTRADVWECDFSEFTGSGEFKIVVENIGCSFPFEIKDDVYREPFYYTMRGLFQQRAGIEKDLSYIEPGLIYHRDHHTDDDGVVMRMSSNNKNVEGVWGWYHDAGDWDGYTSHKRVPLGLLMLYDLAPQNFGDGDIPNRYKRAADDTEWTEEAGNGIPDLLDEAMWLINFYRRAKDALVAQGLGTGGVPGYVGVDAGAEMPAWEDKREMKLDDENAEMTFAYAACAAWLALCLDQVNSGQAHPQSADWISEAKAAYTWAQQKGTNYQMQAIAAAALYRYTAESNYQDDFKTAKSKHGNWKEGLWSSIPDWMFAATCFAKIPDNHPELDIALRNTCKNDIISMATSETVNTASVRGFRLGAAEWINNMLGIFSAPHTSLAAVAYKLSGDDKFLQACYNTSDYQLGGNELNQTYISGLGDRPDPAPFRPDAWFMIDYNSQVYSNPIFPGLLPYGHHKDCDWMAGCDYTWVGDEDYSRSTAYPSIKNFPDAEARFWNRNSIAGSEYTVHQTQIQAIFAYGFLCAPYSSPYVANDAPTVAINLTDDEEVPVDAVKVLSVKASDDTRLVKYYYSWHYIGESADAGNNFAFNWDVSTYLGIRARQKVTITAVAYDNRGVISRPTDDGDAEIKFVEGTGVNLKDDASLIQPSYRLYPNYPNPFNPHTTITYSLARQDHVKLTAYDLQGRQVAILVNEPKEKGVHSLTWNTDGLASGHYFVTLKSENYIETIKVTHLQ